MKGTQVNPQRPTKVSHTKSRRLKGGRGRGEKGTAPCRQQGGGWRGVGISRGVVVRVWTLPRLWPPWPLLILSLKYDYLGSWERLGKKQALALSMLSLEKRKECQGWFRGEWRKSSFKSWRAQGSPKAVSSWFPHRLSPHTHSPLTSLFP